MFLHIIVFILLLFLAVILNVLFQNKELVLKLHKIGVFHGCCNMKTLRETFSICKMFLYTGFHYLLQKYFFKNVYEIYNKREQKIVVGSLDYVRDWSFAGDIMNGALLLSLNDARGSYIMGSGIGTSIKELIQIVFNYFDLNWEKYTDVDESLLRKGDPKIKISDPTKISNEFGWKTELSFEDLIIRCIEKKININ